MDWKLESHTTLSKKIENGNYVYVIYSEYGCKIGYTKSPNERLKQIAFGLPSQECFFIGLFSGEQASKFEIKLHKVFSKQKIAGEWFILDENNLNYISDYLSRNGFKCLIKISIYWANYLLPSIFITGKTQIINKTDHRVNKAEEIEVPRFFMETVLNPDDNLDLAEKKIFMTSEDISNKMKELGLSINRQLVGKYLSKMKIERTAKKIPNRGARYGYYVIIR